MYFGFDFVKHPLFYNSIRRGIRELSESPVPASLFFLPLFLALCLANQLLILACCF